MRIFRAIFTVVALTALGTAAQADSTEARCDIYPKGSDHTDVIIPCTFSQRQGNVTITRSDGVVHELVQFEGEPGQYRDQHGTMVVRENASTLADLIFRFPEESVFVFWDTRVFKPDPNSPTWPFTTAEYDATTLLTCGMVDSDESQTCPAGVLRMVDGQGSVVILSPAEKQFTINFMKDYVNSAAGEVEAELEGDTWVVVVNGEERYEVPLALIEGG